MPIEVRRNYCNTCGRETNHDILASHTDEIGGPWQADPAEIDNTFDRRTIERLGGYEEIAKRVYLDIYEVVRCRGCEEIAFVLVEWPPFSAEAEVALRYPPAMARRAPDWINMTRAEVCSDPSPMAVPDDIRDLFDEIYKAVQAGSRRLVAMGVRAAVETMIINKVGDHGNFSSNLLAFQEAGFLSIKQRESLDSVINAINAGNAAIHRVWEPDEIQVGILLDIAESMINEVFLHHPRVPILKNNVPLRPARVRSLKIVKDEKNGSQERL